MTRQNEWPFSTDHVIKGTESMPENVRNLVRSMYHYARDNNLSIDDVADAVGYHPRNLEKICKGTYDGNLDQVAQSITLWLDVARAERDARHPVLFIETETAGDIFEVCRLAWQAGSIGAIWGESQIGKTHALEEFQRRHDPGVVKLMRFPAGSGRMGIVQAMAEACGLPPRKGLITTVRQRVMRSITRDNFFIFDEVHQPFLTYHRTGQKFAMEFIREVWDTCRCGMVVCGTDTGRDEIEIGGLAGVFKQLDKRLFPELQLPQYATLKDLNAIARHYKLPAIPRGPALDVVNNVNRRKGLRLYTYLLKSAAQLAANRKEPISWQHVIMAHDILAKYSSKTNRKGN